MAIDARPTIASPDDDPYLWLEEIDGEAAVAFADAQSAATVARFGNWQFEADRDALVAIMDRSDNIPFIARRGKHLYNFWKDAANPRGLWRRTSLASFRTETPDWEILLDVDQLAKSEGEDWVWAGARTLLPAHDLALAKLSRGGSDAIVMREFDLTKKAFVPGGFVLPEAKSNAEWLDRDTVLVASSLGEGMQTTSGYARTIRLWTRGEDFGKAKVLFETTPDKMSAFAGAARTLKDGTIYFGEAIGFYDRRMWLGDRTGPKTLIDVPTDVSFDLHHNWAVLKPRTPWAAGGTTYPPDTLLGISLAELLAGDRTMTVLFEPGPRRVLDGFNWNDGKLVLSILDDLNPRFEVLTPAAGGWTHSTLAGLPQIGVVNVWNIDIEETEANGDLLANSQDPLTPATLKLIEAGKAPVILKQAPKTFRSDGLVVSRHEAVSVDGEKIPYVQVGPTGETGDAPVHLYGYGGFEVSSLPYYRASVGKLWLEKGGTSVTANIRGGGEFGTRWHEAGRLAGKKLSHDDFAAVAADLVRRGVTKPSRIAAEGGSNGGLLIANMLTRYPDHFGALFCTVPLIDMRRYSKLLAGASWMAEYGDPDKPEDWRFIQEFSAYQAAMPGKSYPPILLATTRKDDRVHPGHARKLAAKLQAMGYDAHLYEPAAGGHGSGKNNKEQATFMALGYAFLREKIGWVG